jgi:type III restriction enzyme
MELKLENLAYQQKAIQAVIDIFDGTIQNNFDNATFADIRANVCQLSQKEFIQNINKVIVENNIEPQAANLLENNDLCIEMETGTGKTLVYVKTIFELYKHYGFTKFIILVPSVAIRQGVLSTFSAFGPQLENIYGFKPNTFEYDSKKLNKVKDFISQQHPQVMIMTLASFNSEDKILNQSKREDLFASDMPFIEALGKTNPIIIMDEPQEGMDTENSVRQIAKLNPLFKIRYSATHKIIKNLIFRLTPFDSYKQNLVKKIEVLTITEKNDEAALKVEIAEMAATIDDNPKIKLKAWHQSKTTGKFEFKSTGWLKAGANLGEVTNNPSYLKYIIKRISKEMHILKWRVEFENDTYIEENQNAGNVENVWAMQLEWLIRRHFEKKEKLKLLNIKCLSLIFIDRVSNYMGENPIIKNLFIEKYKTVFAEYNEGRTPSAAHIQSLQGYYFAQKGNGEFADNEGGVKEQSKIYDLILKQKEILLSVENPVEFIFSHSALGVGWDNPNVFNIATLNVAYSEIRKRQEIGRGLRICVNQQGQRIYDDPNVKESERINQLTVIPNETYETFVTQYQEEIKAIYGSNEAGAAFSHSENGAKPKTIHFKLNTNDNIKAAFNRFWKAMSKKTDYTVFFDEAELIKESIKRLNNILIPDYLLEVKTVKIQDIENEQITASLVGRSQYRAKLKNLAPLDILEELSENSGLSYTTVISIFKGLKNLEQCVKNPPRFVAEATAILKNVALEKMLRGVTYKLTGEEYNIKFEDFEKELHETKFVETPQRGVYDKTLIDSKIESNFAIDADKDGEVICFLKLPKAYKIKTPIGDYEPDFGLVMKQKGVEKDAAESEIYFVIETKGTDSLEDKRAMSESEAYKIRCAIKHFKVVGVDIRYKAPVNSYQNFKDKADEAITEEQIIDWTNKIIAEMPEAEMVQPQRTYSYTQVVQLLSFGLSNEQIKSVVPDISDNEIENLRN